VHFTRQDIVCSARLMDQRTSSRTSSGGEIIGITLTVDESGQQPAQSLKFWKSSARVVEIGRRSAQAKDDESDGKQALFRCPVISRRHAKITFSEYGNVYVTDLKSHHGTHIMRPGDTVTRAITPEVPNVLADGDVLTFGKAVGKDQDLVRPITVHVELQFSRDMEAVPLAAAVSRETSSPKSGSGRYGVFLPPSDTSSSSDSDSDIEEIPAPLSPSLQTHGFEFNTRLNSLVHEATCALRRDSDMLRRHVLPPISILFTPSPEPPSFGLGLRREAESSFDIYDPEESPESQSDAPLRLPLFSPSTDVDAPCEQPEFIGAWPKSPMRSPSRTPAEENALTHVSSAGCATPPPEEQPLEPRAEITSDDELYRDAAVFASNIWTGAAPEIELAVLQQAEHIAAQQNVRDAMQFVEEGRQDEVQAEGAGTDVLSEHAMAQDVQRAQSQVDLEQGHVPTAAEPAPMESHISKTVVANEDVTMTDATSDDTAALKSLREAMEEMHAQAKKQIQDELNALRTARAEAEAIAFQIREQMAAPPSHNDASTSTATPAATLKRKRSVVIEDEDDTSEDVCALSSSVGIDIPPPVAPRPTKRRKTNTAARIVTTVAKTTAIATLGAVAAWTALAFS